MKNAVIEFKDHIVRKTSNAYVLSIEAAKIKRAAKIGKNSGLFDVPEIVNFNAETGVIEFERIKGLITLFDLMVRKDAQVFELLKKAGMALAVIHEELVLPDEMKMNLSNEWMGFGGDVFCHGDFTSENVCFDKSSNRLVILDWSAPPILGGAQTYGTRYFDLVWCTYDLFFGMPAGSIGQWHACKMADSFLEGYLSSSVYGLSASIFKDISLSMFRIQKEEIRQQIFDRHWPKNIAFLALQIWTYFCYRIYNPKAIFDKYMSDNNNITGNQA